MIKEGKIGLREAIAISTIALVTKVFYTNPGAVIKGTGTAGWYVTLISVAASAVLFLVVYALLKRFPGKNLDDVFEQVFGRFIGKSLSLIFIVYFIFYAAMNLREFVEMIKSYNLPYTQPSIIILVFLLAVVVICYMGFEIVAKVSYIGFWIAIGGIFIILMLAYPLYSVDALFPLGGYGVKKSLSVGILRLSAYDELVILAFFVNSLKGLSDLKKAGLASLVIAGTAISLVILCSILAFDYTMARENLSNLFELSRTVYLSRFFQRLEAIFIFVWVITSVIAVAAVSYTALSIFCRVFKVNNHKPLIPSFVFITFTVSLIPENLPETINIGTNFQRQDSAMIIYFIPLLALIISFIFGKKGEKNS